MHRAGAKARCSAKWLCSDTACALRSLVTAEPCKLLEICGDEFRTLMRKHSDMALYLLAKLSQRLRHTDDLILSRRINSIDGSLGELGTRLDVITQTTDAKLTAAQGLFDQTNTRTAELIHSAERRQAALKYIGAAAASILGLFGFASYDRVTSAIEKIEKSGESAKEELDAIKVEAQNTHENFLGEIEIASKQVQDVGTEVAANLTTVEMHLVATQESEKAAAEAARKAGENAESAIKNASESLTARENAVKNAEEISKLTIDLKSTDERTKVVFSEVVFALLQSSVSDEFRKPRFTRDTTKYYVHCITYADPIFRSEFVDFLHQEIASGTPEARDGYIRIFKWALEDAAINFVENATPELATNYFLALANVLQANRRPTIAGIERIETIVADSGRKDHFVEIFGEALEPAEMIGLLLLDQEEPEQWQRDALSRIFKALKG